MRLKQAMHVLSGLPLMSQVQNDGGLTRCTWTKYFDSLSIVLKMARIAVKDQSSVVRLLAIRNGRRYYKWRAVRPNDDLVIDGYPRSANSFATFAFLSAQSKHVRVGNHLHCGGQFRLAAHLGVPALALVRNPADAITSYLTYDPSSAVKVEVYRYCSIYKAVEETSDHNIVALFENVIKDFGVVTDRLNRRFGTSFAIFSHTSESRDRVMSELRAAENRRLEVGIGHEDVDAGTATISDVKARLQVPVRERVREADERGALRGCFEVYRRLCLRARHDVR